MLKHGLLKPAEVRGKLSCSPRAPAPFLLHSRCIRVFLAVPCAHRPMYCLQMLSNLISNNKLPKHYVVCLDENLSRIVVAITACERILGTPIPLSYTR